MSAMGHEERFPQTRMSAGCGFRKETIVGMRRNGRDAPAACGFETRSQIIWAKNNFAIGRGHYHCKHEPCWYVVRKGSTASWVGDHSQTTLWQIDKNLKSETGHGTQKPVECMRRPIENNASPGAGRLRAVQWLGHDDNRGHNLSRPAYRVGGTRLEWSPRPCLPPSPPSAGIRPSGWSSGLPAGSRRHREWARPARTRGR
jgi:hypothetical protein